MGDFYLLGDEDDEERMMRERFQMAAPERSAYGAPSSDLDPRTMQNFLAQRPADEGRGAYPIPVREQSNPLADNWFPLLATGLDLAVNKGRGLGNIAQGAMVGATARANRDAEAFETDRGAYMKQQANEQDAKAREQAYGLGARNADMRQQEIDLQAAQQRAVMERFLKGQGSSEAMAAELRLKQAQAARAEADAARDPNAITPYQQAQLDAMRDERMTRDEDRNLDRADRRSARSETAELRDEMRKSREATVAEAARARKEVADDKTTREFAKDTETTRSMAHQMQELDPVLQKYKGGDIPGTGKADQYIPNVLQDLGGKGRTEDATRIDQLKTGLQAEYRHEKTGAAASVPEDLRLMIVNGTRPDSTEQEFRLGMEALKKALPLQIRAYGANREEQARAVLREQGLEEFVYGKAPEIPLPPLQPEAPPAAPPPAVRPTGSRLGAPSGGNNFGYSGPPAGDSLSVQPGKPPMVNDYLRKLKDEDDDLGVVYR